MGVSIAIRVPILTGKPGENGKAFSRQAKVREFERVFTVILSLSHGFKTESEFQSEFKLSIKNWIFWAFGFFF